ncbi:hypothetical protein QJS04_geneDACA023055 [Acorus gramineus]|uniref:Uncharacterized protein n=1 Tax=Acorus gramineus TaxID=55184 RepID=A0AAV9AAE6_ACOGR|nr:hypothetical protein QJS04_geneDACA023055 [Acorus gramineus]
MEAIRASRTLLIPSNHFLSPFTFTSSPSKTPLSLHLLHKNPIPTRTTLTRSSPTSSSSPDPGPTSTYGGWDDLELLDVPSKFDLFREFGVDDRKHVLVFLLGVLTASAFSRFRFSYLAVFPVSVLVFAAGFLTGGARAGGVDVLEEKLRGLGRFLSELDVKLLNLMGLIERGEIESVMDVVELMKSEILLAKSGVDDFVASGPAEAIKNVNFDKNSNHRPSRRRAEMGSNAFEFLRFVEGFFKENLIELAKLQKVKESSKQAIKEQLNLKEGNGQVVVNAEEVKNSSSDHHEKSMNVKTGPSLKKASVDSITSQNIQEEEKKGNGKGMDKDLEDLLEIRARSTAELVRSMKMAINKEKKIRNATVNSKVDNNLSDSYTDGISDNALLSYNEDLKKISGFTTRQAILRKMVHQQRNEVLEVQRETHDSIDLSLFTSESEASLELEHTFEIHSRDHLPSRGRKNDQSKREHGTKEISFRERGESKERPSFDDHFESSCDAQVGKTPSPSSPSSDISKGDEYQQILKEANDLLKHAKECLKGQSDEEKAEIILYRSASLLSKAITVNPTSLLAVGQLGNTLLLHGELKLKISRELRELLNESDSIFHAKERRTQSKWLKTQVQNREEMHLSLLMCVKNVKISLLRQEGITE